MIKVCFLPMSGNKCKPPARLTPGFSGVWDTIQGTDDPKEADYFVVLEKGPTHFLESFSKDPERKNKVFCFPQEPNAVSKHKNYNKYKFKYTFDYNTHHHFLNALFFMGGSYDSYASLEYPEKTKLCSVIMSKKTMIRGHKARTNFLKDFCQKYPNVADVYGHGWNSKILGSSYKGGLSNGNCEGRPTKYDGLINYHYSICCENNTEKNVFSEKLTDAFLCWTIPIFFGCSNIGDFFPKDSFYQFDPTDPEAPAKVREILNKPVTEENIKALKIARELCLNRYNIWPSIERLVQHVESGSSQKYNMFRYIDEQS